MTAKEYLQQIYKLDAKVKILRQQVAELRHSAQSISSPSFNERIQTSQTGAQLEKAVERYLALAERTELEALALAELKLEIISRISKAERTEYIRLLTMRYVDGASFERIACEMRASYRQVLRWHGRALQDFAGKNKDVIQCHIDV